MSIIVLFTDLGDTERMSDHGDGDEDHGDGDGDHADGDGDLVITEPGNEAFNSRRNLAGFW